MLFWVFLLSCRRELLGGKHGLCYAFIIPLLNGHLGTKDRQFGRDLGLGTFIAILRVKTQLRILRKTRTLRKLR